MENKYIQIILTNGKKINCELLDSFAPLSTAAFRELVSKHYYDGTIFHRIISNFMVQTGGYKVENQTLKELGEAPTIKGEFASNGFTQNTLHHELGVLSMARTNDPNSATSQFFICAAPCDWLDGSYAAFGRVTDEESKQVILDLSNVETARLSPMFADFPCELIGIETIKMGDEGFKQ